MSTVRAFKVRTFKRFDKSVHYMHQIGVRTRDSIVPHHAGARTGVMGGGGPWRRAYVSFSYTTSAPITLYTYQLIYINVYV